MNRESPTLGVLGGELVSRDRLSKDLMVLAAGACGARLAPCAGLWVGVVSGRGEACLELGELETS